MSKLVDKITNKDIYFIAEMSANHGGSLENALEIVRQAADAGADCLKIQTYTADSMTIKCDNEEFVIHGGLWDGYNLYDLYNYAATPYEWNQIIKDECAKCGIDFLSTPFDREAVDLLEYIGCEAYKIASFELVDIPLIEYAASKGKWMIISCGMGTENEIQDAIDACNSVGNNKIILLKCCSEYPANWDDMNMATIVDMKEQFHLPIGLSDHSKGFMAAVVGASLGACVIEKHIKIEGVESADSEFSMTIEEYAQMVQEVKRVKQIVGKAQYGPSGREKVNLKYRRSIYVVEDMKKNDIISTKNIRCIRPSNGLEPKYYQQILGKRVLRDIAAGEPFSLSMVEGTISNSHDNDI